jgi:hypothetical protein
MATLAVSEPEPEPEPEPAPASTATGGKGVCAVVVYEYEVGILVISCSVVSDPSCLLLFISYFRHLSSIFVSHTLFLLCFSFLHASSDAHSRAYYLWPVPILLLSSFEP